MEFSKGFGGFRNFLLIADIGDKLKISRDARKVAVGRLMEPLPGLSAGRARRCDFGRTERFPSQISSEARPVSDGRSRRVLRFHIPCAVAGLVLEEARGRAIEDGAVLDEAGFGGGEKGRGELDISEALVADGRIALVFVP